MIQCKHCTRGYLTLKREVVHGTHYHHIVCEACGQKAPLKDEADYLVDRMIHGRSIFEEAQ